MMPRLDGFRLLRELRADRAVGDVPVILLSARAGEEASVEGLDAGATIISSSRSPPANCSLEGERHARPRRRRAEAAREAELNSAPRPRRILETMILAFIAFDQDFRYVYLNAEAERIFGIPARRS